MSNEQLAIEGIKKSSGTEQGEYGIDEFISHHLEELSTSYWEKHTGSANPTSIQVISLLVLRSKWDDEETYDFSLPDEVTDYVVSVSFDEDNQIEDIVMES
jgi:hypothetical protein